MSGCLPVALAFVVGFLVAGPVGAIVAVMLLVAVAVVGRK